MRRIGINTIICLTVLCVFWLSTAVSQVTASFTANKLNGCSPLTNVKFTDFSSGNITSRTWYLGQGGSAITGNDSIVYTSYTNPGYYTVKLVVSDGITTDSMVRTAYIRVYQNPVADLSAAPLGGCSPLNVVFQNNSVEGDTILTSIAWDFGDGGFSSGSGNVQYTYTTNGVYDVSLIVTDFFGCEGTVSYQDYITTTNPPVSSFSSSLPVSCTAPHTVDFNNTSGGGTGLTYTWIFGDGGSSTQTHPSYTYQNPGTYDVTLISTAPSGCKDTLVMNSYVSIGQPAANYTTAKDTFCFGEQMVFTNTSAGVSYEWLIGSTSSNVVSPSVTANQPGIMNVQLVAFGPGGGCTDTSMGTVYVEQVIPSYTSSATYACEVPVTVTFTDNSSPAGQISGVVWNFGDPGSGAANSASGLSVSHTYNTTGSFNLTMTVTSVRGCSTLVTLPAAVSTFELTANASAPITTGCVPLAVHFSDLTTPADSVVSWLWNFGDPMSGSNNTSTQPNPTHTYATDGDFMAHLTVTDQSGCQHTDSILINTGTKPVIDFVVDTNISCGSAQLMFTDSSTPEPPKIDEWHWSFGDDGTSASQNPTYLYTDTGYMDVELIVGYNFCYDTLQKDSMLYILGPIVNATSSFDCDSSFVYCFDGAPTIDAQRWEWTFGDGLADSNSVALCHTYSNTGDYTIELKAANDSTGCRDSTSINIFVRDIQAALTADKEIGCSPLNICFDASGSQDATTFLWNYYNSATGNVSGGAQICYTYQTVSGSDSARMVAGDVNGCTDTAYFLVTSYKPTADFSADKLNGCVPLVVQFTDNSSGDTTITSWEWSFGDLTQSPLQNPAHSYIGIGTKTVTLIIRDTLGCRDTLVRTAYITPFQPVPSWQISDPTLCAGTAVQFTNTTSNPASNSMTYSWNFGDGSTSSQANPLHIYNDTGYFSVSLHATDAVLGCDSLVTMTNQIHVQAIPQAGFTPSATYLGCYPDFVQFTDTSISDYLTTWSWNFGDGTVSSIQNPGHQYNFRGFYDITLIVTTSYGCKDTLLLQNYIEVDGPYAEFSVFPDTLCIGQPLTLVVDTMWNLSGFDWDFGDGSVDIFGVSPTTHAYQQVGMLFPKLIYRSPIPGCEKIDIDTVFIFQVKAGFTVSDSVGCENNMIVNFTNTSLAADNYHWYFGDGGDTNTYNASHQFLAPGTYYPTLIISDNETGCVDTTEKEIIVHQLPPFAVDGDTIICYGGTAQLSASSQHPAVFSWTPSNTLNDPNIATPLATPTVTTPYTVVITDTNDCSSSAIVNVIVQQQPVVSTSADTVIIIGELVYVTSSSQLSNVSYTWSPSDGLSCTNCQNPVAQPLETTTYTVVVADSNNCFVATGEVLIEVRKEFTVDVPNTFTPNGDGINDLIYVKGWGIKELVEYTIYNRWGQVVFTTTDLLTGWDGTFAGKSQNIDTYAVTATVITWAEETKTFKGYISLIR